MRTALLSFTVVLTCVVAVQARAVYPDMFLQPQEQAPASNLQCYVCEGPTLQNCTAGQLIENCTSGLVCYTFQAFDSTRNQFINAKGCFPQFLCTGNQGCDMVNASRNGAIQSCSLNCCNTPVCNAAAPGVVQTTAQPATTTAAPATTQPPTTTARPTTTPPPTTTAVTTAPTTVPPPIPPGLCGGPLTPPSGFFASPFYPLNYPNNAYCVWSLALPRGSLLSIDFLFFKTEHCYDYVDIYVGRRLVRRLSGGDDDDDDDDKDKHRYGDDDRCDDDDDDDDDDFDDLDDLDEEEDKGRRVVTIQGTGEMIRIVFTSDYSVTKRGFFARYNVAAPVLCGGPLVVPSGTFTSPGFPANYPNNADCRWSIMVPFGSSFVLEFRTFETERCHDYVQILQGWRAIRRLSGVYGRKDDDYDKDDDDDDDCDDDDDDDDDDDYDGDDKSKWRGIFGHMIRGRFGSQYVKRVFIRGTGEMVTIIFRSDHRITRRGFDVVYHLT